MHRGMNTVIFCQLLRIRGYCQVFILVYYISKLRMEYCYNHFLLITALHSRRKETKFKNCNSWVCFSCVVSAFLTYFLSIKQNVWSHRYKYLGLIMFCILSPTDLKDIATMCQLWALLHIYFNVNNQWLSTFLGVAFKLIHSSFICTLDSGCLSDLS